MGVSQWHSTLQKSTVRTLGKSRMDQLRPGKFAQLRAVEPTPHACYDGPACGAYEHRRSAMDGLFAAEPFRDFGPLGLSPGAPAPAVQLIRGPRAAALRGPLKTLCPSKPGVYGMLDAAGELIYVGKAKQLRLRLASYFRTGSRPAKAGRILRETRAIVWEICNHEFAALLREQELIRRWRPRWNVQGQPLRRRLAFLCVGRPPAPYVFLTRQPPPGAA